MVNRSKGNSSDNAKPEDPIKFKVILEKIRNFDINSSNRIAEMSKLFESTTEVAISMIHYYYLKKSKKSKVSRFFRYSCFIFGAIGSIIPVASPVFRPAIDSILKYYSVTLSFPEYSTVSLLFLAVAGAFYAADQFTGATSGHIRYITSQLQLERLVITNEIEWRAVLANNCHGVDHNATSDGPDKSATENPQSDAGENLSDTSHKEEGSAAPQSDKASHGRECKESEDCRKYREALSILRKYCSDLYEITMGETQKWGTQIIEDRDNFSSKNKNSVNGTGSAN